MTSDEKKQPKWKLGDISIDDNGYFWVNWLGSHAGQGGMQFCMGNMGGESAKDILAWVGKDLDQNKNMYQKMAFDIRKRDLMPRIIDFFDGDEEKAKKWFSLKNPAFGDISPDEMIKLGRHEKLKEWILTKD